MDFWADLWSCLTGLGTLALAATTFAIIVQGRQQRADAERQHRDRLKPICLLAPPQGVDPWAGRAKLVETIAPTPETPGFGTVIIHCVLRNIGLGPALNLRISIRFQDMGDWTTDPWELSPLGAGENRGGDGTPLIVPIRLDERFNQSDFAQLTGRPWEILLDYENVFGAKLLSVHRKSLFSSDPSTITWSEAEPTMQPKATLLALSWFRFDERPEALGLSRRPDKV
jgi:hypothetical protein